MMTYDFEVVLAAGTDITEELARRGSGAACQLSDSAGRQIALSPRFAALWPTSKKPVALSSESRSSTTRRCFLPERSSVEISQAATQHRQERRS